jgi:hypothetical protein
MTIPKKETYSEVRFLTFTPTLFNHAIKSARAAPEVSDVPEADF